MPAVFLGGGFVGLVIALSILSGIGSFLAGKRDGVIKGDVLDFLSEIVLALIVGLITGYLGESYELKRALTCAAVLVLSNNASDSMGILKKAAFGRLVKFFGGKER